MSEPTVESIHSLLLNDYRNSYRALLEAPLSAASDVHRAVERTCLNAGIPARTLMEIGRHEFFGRWAKGESARIREELDAASALREALSRLLQMYDTFNQQPRSSLDQAAALQQERDIRMALEKQGHRLLVLMLHRHLTTIPEGHNPAITPWWNLAELIKSLTSEIAEIESKKPIDAPED